MRTTLHDVADQEQRPWTHHLTRDWIHDRRHSLLRCGISGVVADSLALATAPAHGQTCATSRS